MSRSSSNMRSIAYNVGEVFFLGITASSIAILGVEMYAMHHYPEHQLVCTIAEGNTYLCN